MLDSIRESSIREKCDVKGFNRFSACDDKYDAGQTNFRLLCAGLKKHGLGNWEIIRANFLPNKSLKQIANHFKNMSKRSCPQNTIKVNNFGAF